MVVYVRIRLTELSLFVVYWCRGLPACVNSTQINPSTSHGKGISVKESVWVGGCGCEREYVYICVCVSESE